MMWDLAGERAADAELGPDWDVAYRRHGPDLLAYLRRITRNTDEAADVLQETFTKAIRSKRSPSDQAELRRWLFRIASNEAIDRARRRVRLRAIGFFGQPTEAPANGSLEDIRRALQSIPVDQAVTLVLRLHQGFSRAEIAKMLDISEEAVKSRLARGRLNFAAVYRGGVGDRP
jgi:RNA polymerase sigma factor (sigma-70 family)